MKIVVGVDSGGSRTRALAVTLEGEKVGYAEAGGGNPSHDARHRENVREAILDAAGDREVLHVVAGIAGYDRPKDESWAREVTNVPGVLRRAVVNDAVVAHYGAFGGEPGIVTIQGTGSTIFGVLEDGRQVKNGDFLHYARGGAVWVGIQGLHKLLTSPELRRDEAVVQAAFSLWGVDSLEGLREAVPRQFDLDAVERSRIHGQFARAITASQNPDARAVIEEATREIATGIRLLGGLFAGNEVRVTTIGACVRSEAMTEGLRTWLDEPGDKRFMFVEPAYPPVVGAVLMALRAEGIGLDEDLVKRLSGEV